MSARAPARTASPGRWAAVVVVLLLAAGALVGNAPAPSLRIVRHASVGGAAPRIEADHVRVRVLLPEGGPYLALRFWEHGKSQPLLTVRALRPDRPLPARITLGGSPPETPAPDYAVEPSTLRSEVGWFAVEVRDARGRVATTYFETGRQPPKGYLACSPPRVQRDPGARALAPEAVRASFEAASRAAPWEPALPSTPPAPPPPAKQPPTKG